MNTQTQRFFGSTDMGFDARLTSSLRFFYKWEFFFIRDGGSIHFQ